MAHPILDGPARCKTTATVGRHHCTTYFFCPLTNRQGPPKKIETGFCLLCAQNGKSMTRFSQADSLCCQTAILNASVRLLHSRHHSCPCHSSSTKQQLCPTLHCQVHHDTKHAYFTSYFRFCSSRLLIAAVKHLHAYSNIINNNNTPNKPNFYDITPHLQPNTYL